MNAQPAVLILVIEAGGPQLSPSLFEGHGFHPLQDAVRNLGSAIRETLAFPVGCVLDQQLPGENSGLRKCRGGTQSRNEKSRYSHLYALFIGSNQGVPGTCALRAVSSFISTPIPGRSVICIKPFWMISPSFTQFRQSSRSSIQCHSCARKFGIAAHTCAVAISPIGEVTACGATGT